MNKTLIAIAFAAALPVVVHAASDDDVARPRGPNLERMAERLELTDEQKTRMRTLFEEHRAEREAMRAQMRARMAEVLTPDQLAKMDAWREQRREYREEGRRHHRGYRCDDERS